LLFQVIADRAEQAAIIVTTNLPFSEWPTKIPNARLCKAMLDRLTDRAHIIETGTGSYRFRRTMAQKGGKTEVPGDRSSSVGWKLQLRDLIDGVDVINALLAATRLIGLMHHIQAQKTRLALRRRLQTGNSR
jgi:hypothetical protein